ncbi:MAG: AarF/ABC1/UbiB kinase family protein [Alphaproteobacteria bacterium]|mgnify:FL=1|nr:AarF/ABC1/UbiB kinase family protein [Alphaproteobacteria bacterium]MBT4082823.1 AarF/ABC1/UbiB kinase family protein [Alphaproteobacteria bacterium]MBT4542409.1 AarF/ABC1/UbiB kinase family protein [Alphaproteobacteria bacterium]MBT7745529.1 AarF/ABC1/UbiB kinase family protein [Alphaproteobacteria bacterium]
MSGDEKNSLGGRVRRYARVSGKVGGLAARLAGERVLGLPLDRAKHASALREALGGLKGPLMKVAQIMSTIPEALPDEYVAELTQLQSNAPSMGWPFVKRRMSSELGSDWQSHFSDFEKTASAAASLGQVHHATAVDGRDLACKLQYPDMSAAVEADLGQLKLIFSIYRRYDPSIDTSQIHSEIAARLREELDYDLEGRHMALYRQLLADEDQVHVPQAYPDLSTDRLLTMGWVDGQPLLTYKEADLEVRNTLALNMFRAWYVPFYQGGVIHADPHLGNYSVRDDLSINLLDFGCVRSFEPKFIGGVIDLYRALETKDEALAVHAYETWGFVDLSRDVIDTLNLWAEFVYAPLLEDRPRQIQEFDAGGVYGKDVAAEVARRLREQGGVTPPREFVFMDRAAIGLGGVFLHLKAEINWHRTFHELIAGFDPGKLAARQKKLFKAAGVPLP